MSDFVGARLQLECGPQLGTFVGTVVDVSNEKVTLRNASRNGMASDTSTVTLHKSSIIGICMLQPPQTSGAEALLPVASLPKQQQQRSTAEKLRSIPNATPAYICPSPPVMAPSSAKKKLPHQEQQQQRQPTTEAAAASTATFASGSGKRRVTPTRSTPTDLASDQAYCSAPHDFALGNNSASAFVPYRGVKPQQQQQAPQQPRHNAFSMSAGDMTEDFDFEGNLALFDKQAFYAMVDSGQTAAPDIVRTAQPPQPEPKLRPDQSVLPGGSAQPPPGIQVPCKVECLFATDAGVLVPSVTEELRVAVLSAADKVGLAPVRLAEAFGRSAAEFLIQQMGGASRLQPTNQHQLPQVAVLIGSGRRGLMGLSMARHLADKEVRVHVHCSERESAELAQELSLFRTTGCPVVSNCRELPFLLDYIVLASSEMDSPEHPLAQWCRSNRAPIVSVCPQLRNAGQLRCSLNLQYCLPVATADTGYGSTYLVDAGITKHVYRHVGILYTSPFGHRSVVQLHPMK